MSKDGLLLSVTPERTVRPVEMDPDTSLWLAQTDEDTDELVNELLREYQQVERPSE